VEPGRRAAPHVLAVDRASFDRYFAHDAKVLEYFARVPAQQLGTMARGERVVPASLVAAVASEPGLRGKTLVATVVASLLGDVTGRDVVLVRLQAGGRGPAGEAPVPLADLARDATDAIRRRLRADGPDVPPVLRVGASRDADPQSETEALSALVVKLGEAFAFEAHHALGARRPDAHAPRLPLRRRLVKIFGPMAGPVQRFEDLVLPCRTVATDIQTGERVTIGTGKLTDAFRASSAVPMIWAPMVLDGRVLVDGGVAEPVPADVVHEMGADVCVAVNAVPRLKKDVQTVLARLYRRAKRFDPLSYFAPGTRDMPNMFDVIMNSMQTLEYELGNFKAISADVRINPDLSAYAWIEFYRPEEMIARGAEAALRALPDIKRVVAERVRAKPRIPPAATPLASVG